MELVLSGNCSRQRLLFYILFNNRIMEVSASELRREAEDIFLKVRPEGRAGIVEILPGLLQKVTCKVANASLAAPRIAPHGPKTQP